MYAIFITGGKQYKVSAGDVIRVEKLPQTEGEKITFDKVLAVNDGKSTQVGTPYLDAAAVDTTVTAVGRGEKVIVYKFKAKKDYRRKQGHRQPFTEIRIESVSVGGETIFKAEAVKETVKKDKPAKDTSVDVDEAKKDSKSAEKQETKDTMTDVASKDKPDAEDATEEIDTEAEVVAEEANKAVETVDEEDVVAVGVAENPVEQDESADDRATEAKSTDDIATGDIDSSSDADGTAAGNGTNGAKLKKADIMAILDGRGIKYLKSAKKDELLALLEE